MQDFFLMAAGALGIIVAVVHGVIGHRRLVPPISNISTVQKRVMWAVFQLSTLYWLVGGLLLIAAPLAPDSIPRLATAYTVAFLYGSGAAGNCWATRGRHIGWILLLAATILAVLGA